MCFVSESQPEHVYLSSGFQLLIAGLCIASKPPFEILEMTSSNFDHISFF